MMETTTTTTTTQGQGSDRFRPGTIRIGWRDRRVPMDTPITPRDVARFLRRIARIAARDGQRHHLA
jgi:hypothetical protein